MVRPSMEYTAAVWDPHHTGDINKPWRRNHRDSITGMLMTLKWPSLENRRRHSRLILLFQFVNKLIHIPTQYLPVPSPLTTTRANHDQKFMQQYARTDRYLYSFLPRTIPDWNNLNIQNLSNCNLDFLRIIYLVNHIHDLFLYISVIPLMGFANQ